MFDGLSTMAIAAALALMFILALAAGARVYRALNKAGPDDHASTGAGYLVGASLGLLSLLIGFTLALSLDRFEVRRQLVGAEADAVQTVWLRDQMLDQPYRSHLDRLLRDYVKVRRALANLAPGEAALDASDQQTAVLQEQIWQETTAALREPADARVITTVLQATNEMFTLPSERRAALDADIPPLVLWTLVIVALIAAALAGYALAASKQRHRVASSALFVAVAMTIALIIELDLPGTGFIRVPQAPFERTAAAILSAPPPN
jgi:hypothetical protein